MDVSVPVVRICVHVCMYECMRVHLCVQVCMCGGGYFLFLLEGDIIC